MIKILILLTDLLIFEDISVTGSVYWYNKAVVRDPKENHAEKMAARNPGDEKRKKDFS